MGEHKRFSKKRSKPTEEISIAGAIGTQGVMDSQNPMPKDFDVLLQDVHSCDLHDDISKMLKKTYLGAASEDMITNECYGHIWGLHSRAMLAFHVMALVTTSNHFFYCRYRFTLHVPM